MPKIVPMEIMKVDTSMTKQYQLEQSLILLRNLMQSSHRYVEDGAWLEVMLDDIYQATQFLINIKKGS